MHVICRLFFWLGLAGLALTVLAGVALPAASWTEVRPAAVLGLLVVGLLAWGSARLVPPAMAADPVAVARRRRSSGIAYSIILGLVLVPLAALTLSESGQTVSSAESDLADARGDDFAYGRGIGAAGAQDDLEQGQAGLTVGWILLAAAGLAVVTLFASAARRVPQPPPVVVHTPHGAWQGGQPG